jgi:hypothetical protein
MIEKKKLDDALRQMGPKYVKEPYRGDWTPDKPTTGYCYVVAEVGYHHFAPKGSCPCVMKTGANETHWFVRTPMGEVIDLTSDQFNEPLDYSKGKPQNFMTKEISKRGKILAELLGC